MTGDDRLSTKQRRALEALLTEPTARAAAARAGIGEKTIYRYLRQPAFKAELRNRQGEVVAAATAALAGLTGEAIAALAGLLADPEVSASVKARVALGWLAERRRAIELDDLVRRVEVLEERNEPTYKQT